MTQAALDTKINTDIAKAAWMDAHRRADEIRAAAQAADDEALRLFVDYAELQYPGTAAYVIRLLRKKKTTSPKKETSPCR